VAACAAASELCRHRKARERLLAFVEDDRWHGIHSSDVNDYLRTASGYGLTAKDLRTWHATVFAALALAGAAPAGSPTARRRVVARVMREVAEELGNTPAVARASYVDPRVVERYHQGQTIAPGRPGPAAERAVLDLLA
jgi:DNA topoisomerase IB